MMTMYGRNTALRAEAIRFRAGRPHVACRRAQSQRYR
jgi:hypothetical protein